jgi:hypothetical protein
VLVLPLELAGKDREVVDLVQAERPEDIACEMARDLVNCWMSVANDGGSVGFAFPRVDVVRGAA